MHLKLPVNHPRYNPRTALIFAFLLACIAPLSAQDGKIVVHKDPRIDELLEMYSRQVNAQEEVRGYRIQIVSVTNGDKAYKAQSTFDSSYPQYRSYLTYNSPYFKIRVGDFTDRLDAYRFFQEIKSAYSGAFIVEEEVNVEH